MEKIYLEKEVMNYDVTFELWYSLETYLVGSGFTEIEIENESVNIITAYGELGELTEGKILNEIEKEILDMDFSDYIDLY